MVRDQALVIERPLPVTALICTRNRPGDLADAVSSVLAATPPPAEVLVIDQSTESTRQDWPENVRHVHQTATGLSRARNLGFALARHDVVAILDDDMLVEPDWPATLLQARRGSNEIVTGRVLPHTEPGRHRVPDASLIANPVSAVVRAVDAADPVPGAGVLLPRQAVLAVGGYDIRLGAGTFFGGAEDNDLGLRLLAAGYVVRHVPEAVAWHRGRRRRADRWRTELAYARGKGGFYAKHLTAANLRQRMVRDVGRRLLRAPWRMLSDPAGGARDLGHVAGVTVGLVGWFAVARRRPAGEATVTSAHHG